MSIVAVAATIHGSASVTRKTMLRRMVLHSKRRGIMTMMMSSTTTTNDVSVLTNLQHGTKYDRWNLHSDRPKFHTTNGSSYFSTAAAVTATTNSTIPMMKPFPSLLLGANGSITASGSFAESQKVFLQPDSESVNQIVELLRQTNTGIVAHYYMDVELQGVLQAVRQQLPNHVGIADSLKMGDMAVDMVTPTKFTGSSMESASDDTAPCEQIICLGVDFMSESVAAILMDFMTYPYIGPQGPRLVVV
jgi:hypothetical protein